MQNNDELYHLGVMGMKWGIRRYQNKDGTLTEAGKKRYSKNLDTIEKTPGRVARRIGTSAVSGVTSAVALKTGIESLPLAAKLQVATLKGATYVGAKAGMAIGGSMASKGAIFAGERAVQAAMVTIGAMNPELLAIGAGAAAISGIAAVSAVRNAKKGSKAKKQNNRFDKYASVVSK